MVQTRSIPEAYKLTEKVTFEYDREDSHGKNFD